MMAHGVIDRLEVVEVQVQEGTLTAEALPPSKLGCTILHEPANVQKVSQPIVGC
jgi:hypothetical protein